MSAQVPPSHSPHQPVETLLLPELLPVLKHSISSAKWNMQSTAAVMQAWRELLLVQEVACARCPSWGP